MGAVLGFAAPASAATLPCPGGVGDPATLDQAIVTADVFGTPATITLAGGCHYTFKAPDTSAPAASIDGRKVDLDYWWGPDALPAIAATITIEGNGAVLQRSPSAPPFRFFCGGTGANPGQGLGGAVFVLNGAPVSVQSSTIDANTADAGGALEVVGYDSAKSSDPAAVTLHNSILGGTPSGITDLVALLPSPVSQGQTNIDGSNVAVDGHDIITNLLAGAAELTGTPTRAAPGLAAAAFNGGPGMHTLEPAPESPALGTGDPSTAPPTDERGAARPSHGPVDIGAVQVSGAPATTIAIRAPAPGATYAEGAVVKAVFSCGAPTGVSVDSCTGSDAPGSRVRTAPLGTHTFTVTVSDGDGRTTHRTITYTIAPGAAQLKPLLRALLAKLARSRKLLRSGHASLSFAAPSGGRVLLSVSPRGRSKGKALADGHAMFSKAGTIKLTIRLSRQARKALRTASSVKVNAKATYMVAGLPAVTVTAKIKLRR